MVTRDNVVSDVAENKYVADAHAAVQLYFVHDFDDLSDDALEEHHPEFVHQHFEEETVFGYENLRIKLYYTDVSMHIYVKVECDTDITKVDKNMKPDDVVNLLRAQLPCEQLKMMVESESEFQVLLAKQKRFTPFGELIRKFTTGKENDRTLCLYKVTESTPEFDKYLGRVQTLALWYIDAAEYTDNTSQQWIHYFLYEELPSGDGDGKHVYALAGYSSIFRFYAYPNKIRPRIAQIMLLPHYRKHGVGAKLLQSLYEDMWTDNTVLDITAEDPADVFIYLRNYVDCVNCEKLPEFAAGKLKEGFSADMRRVAQEKFKINKRQARTVYEILRYRITSKKNEDELKSFRLDVKRRLEAPMKQNEKRCRRFTEVMTKEEQATTGLNDPEQKRQLLEQLYNDTISDYKVVIERLSAHPTVF